MKQTISVILMVLAACAAFAGSFSVSAGLSQSLSASSVAGVLSFGSFEIEGSLGVPFMLAGDIRNMVMHPVATGAVMATVHSTEVGGLSLLFKVGAESEFAMTFVGNRMGVGSFGPAFGVDVAFGKWTVGIRTVVPACNILGLMKRDVRSGFYVISGTSQDSEFTYLAKTAGNAGIAKIYCRHSL